MERAALVARLLDGLAERLPAGMSADQAGELLKDWTLVDCNGAVVMLKGPEMHVAAIPERRRRWFGREAIKLLKDNLLQHGLLETSVMRDNNAGHEFARRLGFEPVGDSGAAIRYELRTLRHA